MTLPRKGLCGKRERKEDEVFVSKGRGSGGRKEEEKLKRETREDDSANAESAVLPNKLRHVTSQVPPRWRRDCACAQILSKMASYEEVGEDSPPYPDPLESLPYWGHGPGEDITSLPEGWEARVTPEGRVFFIK